MTDTNVELNVLDYNRVCRTCMKEGEMKSLFEDCASEVCIVEMIMSCTFVQIQEYDGLPDQICLQCLQEVNNAYKFAQKCENTDEILRSFLPSKRGQKRQIKPSTESESHENAENYMEIIDSIKKIEEICVISDEENTKMNNKNAFIEIQKQEEANNKANDSDSDYFLDNDPTFSDETNSNIEKIKFSPKRKAKTKPNQKNAEKKTLETNNDIEIDNTDEVISKEFGKTIKKVVVKPTSTSQKMSPPYECKKCGDQFPVYYMLKEHFKTAKHSKSDYVKRNCPICSKSISYSHMKIHMRTHTQEKPYCCEVCGKRFILGGNLKRHKRIHSGEKPYKCEICERAFTQQQTLKEHIRIHTGEKPYVCNVCGKAFSQSYYFKMHLKKHEQEDSEPDEKGKNQNQEVACDICGQIYRSIGGLKTHQVTHGEKSYVCEECGRGFISLERLKNHLKSHSSNRQYRCVICAKGFMLKSALKDHMLIHTGEKPFQCNYCERAFTQHGHLSYHLRVHTGEKPYSCTYCGKCFALNGNLTVHMRTHTGETPYHCPVCDKGFYDSSSMKKHQRGHGIQVLK